MHLKAPAHDHSFGTRACRMRCARIGARAWAGGGAHVAALEGSRVAVYESAVCIVLSGNICIVHEMPARLPGCSVGESTDSRELESRPEMQGPWCLDQPQAPMTRASMRVRHRSDGCLHARVFGGWVMRTKLTSCCSTGGHGFSPLVTRLYCNPFTHRFPPRPSVARCRLRPWLVLGRTSSAPPAAWQV